MIKVGFIDYYLDEWHANNYPAWLKEASNGEIVVAYCWAQIDSPHGGLTTAQWADKNGITLCQTQDELIEKSDVLCVLAPDNPETHEELTRKALQSGKITYIDKTFAPDLATAKRIFALADQCGTATMTSSALRYATEYTQLDTTGLEAVFSVGGDDPDVHLIHQLEPIVMLCGTEAVRAKNAGTVDYPLYVIEYKDGRRVSCACSGDGHPFQMSLAFKDRTCKTFSVASDFFHAFIVDLVEFYRTGIVTIPHEQTLAVMGMREACMRAKSIPDQWVDIPV